MNTDKVFFSFFFQRKEAVAVYHQITMTRHARLSQVRKAEAEEALGKGNKNAIGDNAAFGNHVDIYRGSGKNLINMPHYGGTVNTTHGATRRKLTTPKDIKILPTTYQQNVFQTSTQVDFTIPAIDGDIVHCALFRMRIKNTSNIPWQWDNLWTMIDRMEIQWNGTDSQDVIYGHDLKRYCTLYVKNIDATADIMGFHSPSEGPGLAYLPRNAFSAFQPIHGVAANPTSSIIPSSTLVIPPGGLGTTETTLQLPIINHEPRIRYREPLNLLPGEEKVFTIDLSTLPLLDGKFYWPNISKVVIPRIRFWFNATDSLIPSTDYTLNQVNYSLSGPFPMALSPTSSTQVQATDSMIDALRKVRQEGHIVMNSMELWMHTDQYLSSQLRSHLSSQYNNFLVKTLLPTRYIVSVNCTTGQEIANNEALTGLHGTFAVLFSTLQKVGWRQTAGRYDSACEVRTLTFRTSGGTVVDFERKEAEWQNKIVNHTSVPVGNQVIRYIGRDWQQEIYRAPYTLGVMDISGGTRIQNQGQANGVPNNTERGERVLTSVQAFSTDFVRDFQDGEMNGHFELDGNFQIGFIPGTDEYDRPMTNVPCELVIQGDRFAQIHFVGDKFIVTRVQGGK